MSEEGPWVPTDREIRDDWDHDESFDRWLADHDARVLQQAQGEPAVVHGINFWDDQVGCGRILDEPFQIALYEPDRITCSECRSSLIRGG